MKETNRKGFLTCCIGLIVLLGCNSTTEQKQQPCIYNLTEDFYSLKDEEPIRNEELKIQRVDSFSISFINNPYGLNENTMIELSCTPRIESNDMSKPKSPILLYSGPFKKTVKLYVSFSLEKWHNHRVIIHLAVQLSGDDKIHYLNKPGDMMRFKKDLKRVEAVFLPSLDVVRYFHYSR